MEEKCVSDLLHEMDGADCDRVEEGDQTEELEGLSILHEKEQKRNEIHGRGGATKNDSLLSRFRR